MLQSFCASFSCNSIAHSGSSALHGVNPNLKKSTTRHHPFYFQILQTWHDQLPYLVLKMLAALKMLVSMLWDSSKS